MRLADLFRRRKPEEGDDLDGCALNFANEDGTETVVLDPEPEEEDDGGA